MQLNMKVAALAAIVFALVSTTAKAVETLTFSSGSIGGAFGYTKNRPTIFLDGSLLDVRLDFDVGIGTEMKLFKYYITESDSSFSFIITESDSGFSFINAEVYYQAVRFYRQSWFGPFIRVNWLDFMRNQIAVSTGLRMNVSGSLNTKFYGAPIRFTPPLIFKYVDLELGYMYRNQMHFIYTAVSVDLSSIVALLIMGLGESARTTLK